MARQTWNVESWSGSAWVADGTIYRPNANTEIDFTSTQTKINLANGGKGFVTPEVPYENNDIILQFIEIYPTDAFYTKVINYVQTQTCLRITTHLGEQITGKFFNVRRVWVLGVDDVFDLEIIFQRMDSPIGTGGGTLPIITDAPSDGSIYGRKDGAWAVVTGGGGTWGSITGTLALQTDLQNALDDKLDISGLNSNLTTGTFFFPIMKYGLDYNKSVYMIDPTGLDQTNNYSGFVLTPISLSGTSFWVLAAQCYATHYHFCVGSGLGNIVFNDFSDTGTLLQDNAGGDVELFKNGVIGAGVDGKALSVYRNANYIQSYVDQFGVGILTTSQFQIAIYSHTVNSGNFQIGASSGTNNRTFKQSGYITSAQKYIQYQLTAAGNYELTREDANVLGFTIDMPLDLVDNSLTTTGTVETGAVGSTGRVKLNPGDATHTGYIEWLNGSGTRLGYFGYDNTNMNILCEQGTKFSITGKPVDFGSENVSTTGNLSAGADTDSTHIFGRGAIWSPFSDYVAFCHYDLRATANSYALLQYLDGRTFLNSAVGQVTSFRINNVDIMTLSSTLLNMGGTNLTTTGTLEAGATTVTNLTDSGLTITRIPYASTGGLLIDSSKLTFDGTILSPNYILLAAGTTAASTAPLKFTAGTLNTTIEAGTIEYTTGAFKIRGDTLTIPTASEIQGTTASNTAYLKFNNNSGTRKGYVGVASSGSSTITLASDSGAVVLSSGAATATTMTMMSGGYTLSGASQQILNLKDTSADTTTKVVNFISFSGATALGGADGAGRVGFFGFSSTSTTNFHIANEIVGAKLYLVAGGGSFSSGKGLTIGDANNRGDVAVDGMLTLRAGTATAGTAPLKFTSGVDLGTAEDGAMEYDGTNLHFTYAAAVRDTIPTVAKANIFTEMQTFSNTTDAYGRLLNAYKQDFDLSTGNNKYILNFDARTTTGAVLGSREMYSGFFATIGQGTGTQSGLINSIYVINTITGAGTYTGAVSGVHSTALYTGSGPITEMNGVYGFTKTSPDAAGTVTWASAFRGGGWSNDVDSTVTNWAGLYILNYRKYAGTFGTAYGVYLAKQVEAATNWQFYSIDGNSAFGGNTRFGGVTAPTVAVDVTGAGMFSTYVTTPALRLTSSTPTALAGDVNDWDVGNKSFIRASGGAADRIVTGILSSGVADGHIMIICNIGTTNKIQFTNESASSSAANRILTNIIGTVEIPPQATIQLIYDSTSSRWRETSHL
jgi:hypothetical protein